MCVYFSSEFMCTYRCVCVCLWNVTSGNVMIQYICVISMLVFGTLLELLYWPVLTAGHCFGEAHHSVFQSRIIAVATRWDLPRSFKPSFNPSLKLHDIYSTYDDSKCLETEDISERFERLTCYCPCEVQLWLILTGSSIPQSFFLRLM